MPAKDALGSSAEKKEAKKQRGSGTKISGYVDTPVAKKCGTCEYLHNGTLCTQKNVLKDPEVPFAARSKFKKVSAENGCCSFWEADADKDD